MQPGRDAGEDPSMAREGYFILDSDLHLMEPYDLWERYLEGPHKANPPHFFAAHRRPEEEIKVVGMEVQGLAIPAHGRRPPGQHRAAEARATNGNLTVSLRQADRCGGMRVDDWCLRTGRHQLGAAGQREGDGPSHNGGDKAGALSRDHGSQGYTDL